MNYTLHKGAGEHHVGDLLNLISKVAVRMFAAFLTVIAVFQVSYLSDVPGIGIDVFIGQ